MNNLNDMRKNVETENKYKVYIYGVIIFFIIVFLALFGNNVVNAKGNECENKENKYTYSQPELKLIDATAYYDSYGHGYGADGRKLVEDLTIAGRVQDLGKTAILYDMDYRLIGIYEFRDTGYGQATGYGNSQILKGKSVGTIENGTCVDIYMGTKSKCQQFGRQKVYIQIVDAKG